MNLSEILRRELEQCEEHGATIDDQERGQARRNCQDFENGLIYEFDINELQFHRSAPEGLAKASRTMKLLARHKQFFGIKKLVFVEQTDPLISDRTGKFRIVWDNKLTKEEEV